MFLNDTVKYKLPIQFSFYTGNTPVGGVVGEDGCDFGYNFESNRIHNAKKLGISKPVDIYKKLKPFLKYLISKIGHEVQFPYRTVVDVFLSSERQGYRMVHFELNENFTNDGVLILQYFTSIFKKAFRLQVYANCYCPPGLRVREGIFPEDESDSDSDTESEAQEVSFLPLQDHFKTEQCVICLENEPSILFVGCRHICVCVSCDAAKPSYKCSYCRAKIFQIIKI